MRFSAVLLLVLLRVPATANLVLDRLEVDLWPEYDRPGVLVIYRIRLAADAALPQSLQFRIPSDAGEPNAVASLQPDGSLVSLPYDREVSGSWSTVSFSVPTAQSQLEYYDPSLQTQGTQRQYTYLWPGDYEVRDLTLQVQQPVGATAMQINPPLGAGVVGSDGLLYFGHSLGPISAGQQMSVTLAYEKSGLGLSFERLRPLQPIMRPPSVREQVLEWAGWPVALAGTGVLLVVVGLVFLMWARRRVRTGPARKVPARGAEAGVPTPEARFCYRCGYPAGEADLYCRMCGTRLGRGESR
jgi:hypothetical protein